MLYAIERMWELWDLIGKEMKAASRTSTFVLLTVAKCPGATQRMIAKKVRYTETTVSRVLAFLAGYTEDSDVAFIEEVPWNREGRQSRAVKHWRLTPRGKQFLLKMWKTVRA